MDVSQTSEHIAQDSLDISSGSFTNMVQLLNILGNEDALSIFLYSHDGFSSSKIAILELGLSQKRFYTRLKDLIDIGLLEKDKGKYQHTPLGKIFFKIGLSLLRILENKEKTNLFADLKNIKSESFEDYNKIKSMVSDGSYSVNKILDLVFLSNSYQIQVYQNQEKYNEKLINEINSANNDIKYASKNIDLKVIDSLFQSMNRGVKLRIISEKYDLDDKINKFQVMLSPKIIMSIMEFFSSSDIDDQMRESEILFNFCVIDGNRCFIELPSLYEYECFISFFLIDDMIGKKITSFHDMKWDSSKKVSILNIFKK